MDVDSDKILEFFSTLQQIVHGENSRVCERDDQSHADDVVVGALVLLRRISSERRTLLGDFCIPAHSRRLFDHSISNV